MRNTDVAKKRGRFNCSSGSNIHTLYSSYYDERGVLRLEKVGEEDTDQAIESYRQSTELSTIIARFLNGDESALNVKPGFYADLTQAPATMRDALHIVMAAEDAFLALPLDVRNQFGNDWQKWIAVAGTEDWMKVMQPFSNSNARAKNDLNENVRASENKEAASPPSVTSS